jgi:hypothetical protein
MKGKIIPPYDMQCRIEVMSRRWPKGGILCDCWPKPSPKKVESIKKAALELVTPPEDDRQKRARDLLK